jgi:carboxymethylenebutenolidase
MASNMVTVTASDGKAFQCHVSRATKTPAPVLVVIQEIFGITDWLKSFADNLAQHGFTVIVPDLFFRLEPGLKLDDNNEKDLEKAFKCYGEFDQQQGIKDLKDVVKFARSFEGANGKVGCVGFCLGGLMAFQMACHSDVDSTVAYYGGGIDSKLADADSIKKPILMHFADNDKFIPESAIEKISEKMSKVSHATIYRYAKQDHAFARIGGHAYNKEAAELANKRTVEFFEKTLLGAPAKV